VLSLKSDDCLRYVTIAAPRVIDYGYVSIRLIRFTYDPARRRRRSLLVRALIQAASKEFASDGITVNAYCPGVVGTDICVEIDRRMAEITGAEIGENYEKYVGGIALGRAETPEDVATFVSHLAGPDLDYMTGQAPMIDGGLVYR